MARRSSDRADPALDLLLAEHGVQRQVADLHARVVVECPEPGMLDDEVELGALLVELDREAQVREGESPALDLEHEVGGVERCETPRVVLELGVRRRAGIEPAIRRLAAVRVALAGDADRVAGVHPGAELTHQAERDDPLVQFER